MKDNACPDPFYSMQMVDFILDLLMKALEGLEATLQVPNSMLRLNSLIRTYVDIVSGLSVVNWQ